MVKLVSGRMDLVVVVVVVVGAAVVGGGSEWEKYGQTLKYRQRNRSLEAFEENSGWY